MKVSLGAKPGLTHLSRGSEPLPAGEYIGWVRVITVDVAKTGGSVGQKGVSVALFVLVRAKKRPILLALVRIWATICRFDPRFVGM
jgi:hypothetical protein